MAGPEPRPPGGQGESRAEPERLPPGEFVSPDLQTECARFLEDVKSLVDRRRNWRPGAFGPVDDRKR